MTKECENEIWRLDGPIGRPCMVGRNQKGVQGKVTGADKCKGEVHGLRAVE